MSGGLGGGLGSDLDASLGGGQDGGLGSFLCGSLGCGFGGSLHGMVVSLCDARCINVGYSLCDGMYGCVVQLGFSQGFEWLMCDALSLSLDDDLCGGLGGAPS